MFSMSLFFAVLVSNMILYFDESIASKYEVLAAPTFVAFNKGAETGRIAGKTTRDALLGLFEGLV